MGKEEQEPQQTEKEGPKKIIKKLPFKSFTKGKKTEDDDLKDWKPMKIVDKIEEKNQ